jgi:hypothetical protein
MGRWARRVVRASAVLAIAGLSAAGACTVWNGVTVTVGNQDASKESSTSDAQGDAGSDGSAPLAYLSTQAAAQLCALVFACPLLNPSIEISISVPIDPNNFSLCMDWAAGPIPATRIGFSIQQGVLQCLAQATSCSSAGQCVEWETLGANDPRCNVSKDASTESGTYCIDDASTEVDCPALIANHCAIADYTPGQTCNVGTDGVAYCSLGGVDGGCPDNPDFPTCMSTFEDYCANDNLHSRYNCATFGDTCEYDDAGDVLCGTPCTILGPTCLGPVVESCDGTELSPFDCTAFGGTCKSANNTAYCAQPSDKCTPFDPDINVCNGTSISLCVGGVKSSFDCSTIGGKTCVPGIMPQTPHCG